MFLDETILQSRTTLTLVDFIKKLWKAEGLDTKFKLQKEYKTIIDAAKKAEKKRNNKLKYHKV